MVKECGKTVMVEQCGGTREQCCATVLWNSGTVMVEQCWWNSVVEHWNSGTVCATVLWNSGTVMVEVLVEQ